MTSQARIEDPTKARTPRALADAYVNELKAKHMDEYVDIVNKAYQRYREKHG